MAGSYLSTDPLDLLLTADGDLYMGPDGPQFVTGLVGVAQCVRVLVRLFVNEWFLNLDAGVDWDSILGEKLNESFVRTELTRQILAAPAVLAVTSMVLSFDDATRVLSVTYSASTLFGDINNEILVVPVG